MPECTHNPEPIPILVYHQIDVAPPKGAAFRSLYVAPKAFARQMRFLKALGYQGLSMTQLLPYLRGEKRGKGAFDRRNHRRHSFVHRNIVRRIYEAALEIARFPAARMICRTAVR